MRSLILPAVALACGFAAYAHAAEAPAPSLPNTAPLQLQGDPAEQMVAGIDRFLLRELDQSVAKRSRHWQCAPSSAEKYNASVAPNRARLAKILGVVAERERVAAVEFIATTSQPARIGHGQNFEAFAVRWPVVRGVQGEGLLLQPTPVDRRIIADVVVLPDADQTPAQLAGLEPGIAPEHQLARRLAESGCRVLAPALINRDDTLSKTAYRATNQPHREFLYRPAFELGRHIIGYEVQKVLAAVDWFAADSAETAKRPIGVAGYGEGGLLALHAAALDTRIDASLASGYFGRRQDVWQEPIYRNVFGLLDQFGDAELASLVTPRALIVEACRVPDVTGPPAAREGRSSSAAPGRLVTPPLSEVRAEVDRANALIAGLNVPHPIQLVASADGDGPCFTPAATEQFLKALDATARLTPLAESPELAQGSGNLRPARAPLRSDQYRHAAVTVWRRKRPRRILVGRRSHLARSRQVRRLDRIVSRALLQRGDRPLRRRAAAAQSALAADP